MHHPLGIDRRLLAAAAAIACGALGLIGATRARADDLASCQFETHIALNGGTFSSDSPGSSACTGMLSGRVSGSGGGFITQGSYDPGACMIDTWYSTFDARVPVAISLFVPQSAEVSGSVRLTWAGQAFTLSGGGTVDGKPVGFVGSASFTPDGGHSCSATGGTLTEHIAVVDSAASSSEPTGPASSAQPNSNHHRRHRKVHTRRHHHRS
jgi:hypothetical protein